MKFNITAEHEWFTCKDWRWRLTMRDEATGEVLDITGWTFEWVAKAPGATPASPAVVELTGASVLVVDGPNGLFDIIGSREDVDAEGIGNKHYAHELRRTNVGSERVVGWGDAFLMQSITG